MIRSSLRTPPNYIEVATLQKKWEDGMVNKFAGMLIGIQGAFLKGRGNSTIRGSGCSWEFQKSIPKKVSIIAGVPVGQYFVCLLLSFPFLSCTFCSGGSSSISSVARCLMLLSMLLSVPFRRKLSIDTPVATTVASAASNPTHPAREEEKKVVVDAITVDQLL